MSLNTRNLLLNRNLIWAFALVACSAGSYFAGSLLQDRAMPSVVDRLDKLQAALVAQNAEFAEARANAERRIAMMAVRVEEMKAALVQMETWQTSLEEMGGEPLLCPKCRSAMVRRDVRPRSDVSYVRDRVWLMCERCRRTAVLERK